MTLRALKQLAAVITLVTSCVPSPALGQTGIVAPPSLALSLVPTPEMLRELADESVAKSHPDPQFEQHGLGSDAEVLLGGISTPPNEYPLERNSVIFSGSVGWIFDRDAWFWGVSADYNRALDEHWSLGIALTFDQETERRAGQSDEVTNSLSVIGAVSYSFNEYLTVSTGLSKGFADDGNPQESFKFADGDWGTGVSLGLNLPLHGNLFFIGTGTFEYNITGNEFGMSFDLGLSLVF